MCETKILLFSFENSHNWSSGRPINKIDSDKMAKAAKEVGLRVHVDGARIFNSAVSLGIPVKELTENVDSVTFCLSKGLGCPIGSVIVGEKDQIIEARRVRKILGSAMRQVGVIASCGIVALDTMIERLEDDHENAKKLAIGLSEMDIIEIDADKGFLKVNLSNKELAKRRKKWKPKKTEYTSGTLWKYSQSVGPAFKGAVTHPGASKEKKCYADI